MNLIWLVRLFSNLHDKWRQTNLVLPAHKPENALALKVQRKLLNYYITVERIDIICSNFILTSVVTWVTKCSQSEMIISPKNSIVD